MPAGHYTQLKDYLLLLCGNTDYLVLFLGEVVTQFGNWFNLVASYEVVEELTGRSGVALAVLLVIRNLPRLVWFPFAGAVADTYNRGYVMLIVSLLQGLFAAAIPAILASKSLWLFFAINFVEFSLTTFYDPARGALIPMVVPQDQLILSSTLDSLGWSLMGAVGASMGGFAVTSLGLSGCFYIDAISFVLAGLCALRVLNVPRQKTNEIIQPESPTLKPAGVKPTTNLPSPFSPKILTAKYQRLDSIDADDSDAEPHGDQHGVPHRPNVLISHGLELPAVCHTAVQMVDVSKSDYLAASGDSAQRSHHRATQLSEHGACAAHSTEQRTAQSTEQSTAQSSAQCAAQSTGPSTAQSTAQCTGQSTAQSTAQCAAQSTGESTEQSAAQSITTENTTQSTAERTKDLSSSSHFQAALQLEPVRREEDGRGERHNDSAEHAAGKHGQQHMDQGREEVFGSNKLLVIEDDGQSFRDVGMEKTVVEKHLALEVLEGLGQAVALSCKEGLHGRGVRAGSDDLEGGNGTPEDALLRGDQDSEAEEGEGERVKLLGAAGATAEEMSEANRSQGQLHALREGGKYLLAKENRHILLFVMIKACGAISWGGNDVINAKWAEMDSMHVLGGQAVTLGVIYSMVGVGCFFGPLFSNSLIRANVPGWLTAVAISFAMRGTGYMVLTYPNFWILLASSIFRSAGSNILWISSTALLQSTAANERQGCVFAFELAVYTAAVCVSTILTGVGFDQWHWSGPFACFVLGLVTSVLLVFWSIQACVYRRREQANVLSSIQHQALEGSHHPPESGAQTGH